MYQTVNFNDFCDAFRSHDRQAQFSYAAKRIIFDYLEELDENYELDVVAICCEYTEAHWSTIADYYNMDLSEFADDEEDEKEAAVIEFLQDNTSFLGSSVDGIVYADF